MSTRAGMAKRVVASRFTATRVFELRCSLRQRATRRRRRLRAARVGANHAVELYDGQTELLLQIGRSKGLAITLLRAPQEVELRAERDRLGKSLLDSGAMERPRAPVAEPVSVATSPGARVSEPAPTTEEGATHDEREEGTEERARRRV